MRDQGQRGFGVEDGGIDSLRGSLPVHFGEGSLLTSDKAIQVALCTLCGPSRPLISAAQIGPQAKKGPGCGESFENTTLTV